MKIIIILNELIKYLMIFYLMALDILCLGVIAYQSLQDRNVSSHTYPAPLAPVNMEVLASSLDLIHTSASVLLVCDVIIICLNNS